MAHITQIDGTAYEIGGGKTLVDGTEYSIGSGKTLAEGTEYDVGFIKYLTITGNGKTVAFVEVNNSVYYEGDATIPFKGSLTIYCRAYASSESAAAINLNNEAVRRRTSGYAEYTYTATGDVEIILLTTGASRNAGAIAIYEL